MRTTPITLLNRRTQALWRQLSGPGGDARLPGPRARQVLEYLAQHGASFFDDIVQSAGLLKSQVEEALAELVAAGLAHSDSFAGLRALLIPTDRQRKLRRRGTTHLTIEEAGRWTPLQRGAEPQPSAGLPPAAEHVARVLLKRYGIVCKNLLERESRCLPSWYELLTVYRRLEARGEIRGGRFVAGLRGEQYALPEAVAGLRALRRERPDGRLVALSAADPLNLVGVLTPGARVPALSGNRVLYRDGVPIAVHVAGAAQFLETLAPGEEWTARNALLRSPLAPGVRAYLH